MSKPIALFLLSVIGIVGLSAFNKDNHETILSLLPETRSFNMHRSLFLNSNPQSVQPDDNQNTTLEIDNEGRATVVGTVLENNKGCTVDLKCYLRLQMGDEEIRIIYGSGEGDICSNAKATEQGFKIQKGQKIKAYGTYRKLGKQHFMSTCPSDAFYILPLTQNQ